MQHAAPWLVGQARSIRTPAFKGTLKQQEQADPLLLPPSQVPPEMALALICLRQEAQEGVGLRLHIVSV